MKGSLHAWGYHGEAPGGPIEVCKNCGVNRFNRASVEPCQSAIKCCRSGCINHGKIQYAKAAPHGALYYYSCLDHEAWATTALATIGFVRIGA